MKAIDRLAALGERMRRRPGGGGDGTSAPPAVTGCSGERAGAGGGAKPAPRVPDPPVDRHEEAQLWDRLREDPNDLDAFPLLADIVRRRAAEGHEGEEPERAADDAVWALAEELAHNGRAWYPLVELARLSIHGDRAAALRRLGTAAERDHTGHGLAAGLAMLRDADLPNEALGLGVAYWRPREHSLDAGRHLVLAAVEAGRVPDARRHLAALSQHPDEGRVSVLRDELEDLIAQLEAERASGGPMTDPAGIPVTGPLAPPAP
ncbi:MAG TPA: hypothetical protein VI248_11915 [Kineosporiaceae bacterium]